MKKKQVKKQDFIRENKLFLIIAGVCLAALIVMIVALALTGPKVIREPFTPPPFETAAQQGMPSVEDESWSKVFQPGMTFIAWICGRVELHSDSADVYFTNDVENEVWLKLRITDTQGNILAESGLIKPGEYLQTVTFTTVPEVGTDIVMRMMAYEPDTYHSQGSVALNTTVVAPE